MGNQLRIHLDNLQSNLFSLLKIRNTIDSRINSLKQTVQNIKRNTFIKNTSINHLLTNLPNLLNFRPQNPLDQPHPKLIHKLPNLLRTNLNQFLLNPFNRFDRIPSTLPGQQIQVSPRSLPKLLSNHVTKLLIHKYQKNKILYKFII